MRLVVICVVLIPALASADLPASLSVILATAGLFGIVFGLIRGNSHGWTSAQVLGSLAAGGLLIAGFLAWESRAPHPMMPPSLFPSGFPWAAWPS